MRNISKKVKFFHDPSDAEKQRKSRTWLLSRAKDLGEQGKIRCQRIKLARAEIREQSLVGEAILNARYAKLRQRG